MKRLSPFLFPQIALHLRHARKSESQLGPLKISSSSSTSARSIIWTSNFSFVPHVV